MATTRKKFLTRKRNKEKRKTIQSLARHYRETPLIAITRFNDITFTENKHYRTKHNIQGCLYGSPIPISKSIPLHRYIYVLEMNNTTNTIEGIGKIKNAFNPHINASHKFKLYSEPNYSRFVYKGKRVDKTQFSNELSNICDFLEWFLFYGYGPLDDVSRGRHMKRGMGINLLPPSLLESYQGRTLHLDKQIHYYFTHL